MVMITAPFEASN